MNRQSKTDHALRSKEVSPSKTPLIAGALVLAAALATLYYFAFRTDRPNATGDVPIGGAFTLTTHEGERVRDTDFRGRYMLIYFGYSYCPDVCPTELAKMGRALEIASADGVDLDHLAPLFITVDPARDTVVRLAEYVPLFHPRLVGLTGSEAEIGAVTDAYRVHVRKAPQEGAGPEEYLVDHTSVILLMGPDGRFVDVFTARELAQDIAASLADLLG